MKSIQTVSPSAESLSDSQLLTQIRSDAASERSLGLSVIQQLREISRRRLDSRLGYSSLHKFCMEELKYSSGSAWRRIKAMEALDDLPELETQIAQGDLTLASISQVQSFCDQKDKTIDEKKAILEQVVHLSKRETERVLAAIAPMPERPEKLRILDADHAELRITLDAKTVGELDRVRDLIAHSNPGASYAEIISYLARLGLKKLDPAARPDKRSSEASKDSSFPPGESVPQSTLSIKRVSAKRVSAQINPTPVKAIPVPIRRAVWARDRGRCGYQCPETGRICGATAFIQLDHIVPRAKGGSNDVSNLRLRCQSHNLLAAIQEFGAGKMDLYLRTRG